MRASNLTDIALQLRSNLADLQFQHPIAHVYHPLEYAWEPHQNYLKSYGERGADVLLIGMNPGPWGMAQTGVPFGDVGLVRDWLQIHGAVGRPGEPHPKRPILGFACTRKEGSGRRLWGWARERFDTPDRFFARFFVVNHCPLLFLLESGTNLTPDKLPLSQRAELLRHCDVALRNTVEVLQPRWVVGVGKFAEQRALMALQGINVNIGSIPHPSPASPLANRGWAPQAEAALARLGISVE